MCLLRLSRSKSNSSDILYGSTFSSRVKRSEDMSAATLPRNHSVSPIRLEWDNGNIWSWFDHCRHVNDSPQNAKRPTTIKNIVNRRSTENCSDNEKDSQDYLGSYKSFLEFRASRSQTGQHKLAVYLNLNMWGLKNMNGQLSGFIISESKMYLLLEVLILTRRVLMTLLSRKNSFLTQFMKKKYLTITMEMVSTTHFLKRSNKLLFELYHFWLLFN